MSIIINIKKKHLYILTLFLVALGTTIFVLAYGTNNPSQFGHTYTEVQGLPNPSTIWTSNNDGGGSGLDADRIDSQDVVFRDMSGPNNPKICVNKGTCGAAQQTACQGRGIISKYSPGCLDSQCASGCNTFCTGALCSWDCNGDLYPECNGGNRAYGSQSCTQSSGGSCNGDYCECDCISPGQNYQKEIRVEQLYCATMTIP